jgi:pimeloyl-ACP methyl ester carboxylesterase
MTLSFLAMLLRVAALLGAGFVGFCLLLYWRQEAMLFFPEQASLATVRHEASNAGFRLWPEETASYRALLAEPPGPVVATCIVWHGNAGSARQRDYLTGPLLQLGLRVIVAEYPGYGARPPGNRREAALAAEAKALTIDVKQHFGGPVILLGESLGAAMAAAVAGDPAIAVTGVVMITPWHDLAAVGRVHYPWLPVGLLLRDRFDNAAALQDYRGPLVVVTAAADEIIPAAEGRRLYQALPTPAKRFYEIPDAYHNDWVERATPGAWQEWLHVITTGL